MNQNITGARHFLTRTGFAETPQAVLQFADSPPTNRIAERLESSAPIAPLPPPAWTAGPIVSYATFKDLDEVPRRAARQRLQKLQREQLFELQAWWIENLIVTADPLGARMTLFWQNHFTSQQRKVRYTELMFRQHQTLMAHATGRFDALLQAMLTDPAMLIYLDNNRSRRNRLNENLARELLELFTLGEGAYGEEDIRELARALTGLTVDAEHAFVFRRGAHDPTPKSLLGVTDVGGLDDVVALLSNHRDTARHLAIKLWRHFVSIEPDPDAIDGLAEDALANELDIGQLLSAVLAHDEFANPAHVGALVKSPLEFVVGTHRALALSPIDAKSLVRAVRSMQQIPYEPPNVRGWVGGKHWINSATLLARGRFINRILRDDALELAALHSELTPETLTAALLPLQPVDPLVIRPRAGARFDPVAQLLRDPVYNLC